MYKKLLEKITSDPRNNQDYVAAISVFIKNYDRLIEVLKACRGFGTAMLFTNLAPRINQLICDYAQYKQVSDYYPKSNKSFDTYMLQTMYSHSPSSNFASNFHKYKMVDRLNNIDKYFATSWMSACPFGITDSRVLFNIFELLETHDCEKLVTALGKDFLNLCDDHYAYNSDFPSRVKNNLRGKKYNLIVNSYYAAQRQYQMIPWIASLFWIKKEETDTGVVDAPANNPSSQY